MKKFFIVMIFAISTLVVVGGNSIVQAQMPVVENRSGGLIQWCIRAAECILGYLCIKGVCTKPEVVPRSTPTCLCLNDKDCYQRCGVCGFVSEGTGPSQPITHDCLNID